MRGGGGGTFGAGVGVTSSSTATDFNLRGVSLLNTVYSEVAPCFPLPSLAVFCGAFNQEIRLFDGPPRSLNRYVVVAQASKIADLLRNADVSYLNFIDTTSFPSESLVEPLELYKQVLRYNSSAFECITPDPKSTETSISKKKAAIKPFDATFKKRKLATISSVAVKVNKKSGRSSQGPAKCSILHSLSDASHSSALTRVAFEDDEDCSLISLLTKKRKNDPTSSPSALTEPKAATSTHVCPKPIVAPSLNASVEPVVACYPTIIATQPMASTSTTHSEHIVSTCVGGFFLS